MTISAPMQRFVDDELSRTDGLAERTLTGTLEQLRQPRDGMLSSSERQHYAALVDALQRQAHLFKRNFTDQLRALVLANLAGLESAADDVPDPAGGLQLMDETRVESDIEISRAAQLIDGSAEWELRELQTFVSTLAGQKHVSPEANPLRPLSYARALWHAGCAITQVPVQHGILVRTAAGVISGQLKKAWAAACTRLEAQGIEPGIYRTVIIQPGSAAAAKAPDFDLTKPGELEKVLATMPTGGAGSSGGGTRGQPSSAPASAQEGFATSMRGGRLDSQGFQQALQNLEVLLLQAQSASTAMAQPPMDLRSRLLAIAGESDDRQIVELLSRLFDAMLSDEQFPHAFARMMGRLQVSALRVAMVDPAMLGSHDHPVWHLMNQIAAAAERHSQTSDPRLKALLAMCEDMVDDIARTPKPDAQTYKKASIRLEAFLSHQLREQQAEAQASIDALSLAERRGELERQLSHRLAEQMANIRTTAPIRRFITGTWATVLADSMLRFGEKVEPTLGYLRAVDELLWSLRLPDHPQSRQRLITLLPGLLQRVRAGMAQISLAAPEQQATLDELMSVHTEALKPGNKNVPEPELTSQQIVQRLRDEIIDDTPSRRPFSDTLIDLQSMDTVPADALPEYAAGDDPAQRIESMAPGARYRLFLHGHWTRAQLLWRSPKGEYFLFAGDAPGRRHSVTRRALERLAEERLAVPLGQPSLIQRSVDRLMRKLVAAGG